VESCSGLSRITIQDLEIGVLLAERRDPRQGAILRRWLEDALIVATALVHDLTLVTRNRADFERTEVTVFDPWSAPGPVTGRR
jgi:hypothetical protein